MYLKNVYETLSSISPVTAAQNVQLTGGLQRPSAEFTLIRADNMHMYEYKISSADN
jgi:hypothetical protein